MINLLNKSISTDQSKTTCLIRSVVGFVFLSEGIQKFLFATELGSGRFLKIGIPYPEFFGPFVGATEICCGVLILFGLFTRLASIPLLCIMLVAMITTKGTVFKEEGFWALLHGSRTDWSMLLCSVYLLIRGGGKWSIDVLLKL